jgi:hypothetical protein
MLVLVGAWFALAGGISALAGLCARQQTRRLRRTGLSAWATAVAAPASGDDQPDGPVHRTLIRYTLTDGRVVEQASPRPARKSASLHPGQKVLVWYNPQDPLDVVVYGQEGRLADRAFVVVGVVFVLLGVAIAVSG